jgi:hypothetical protein
LAATPRQHNSIQQTDHLPGFPDGHYPRLTRTEPANRRADIRTTCTSATPPRVGDPEAYALDLRQFASWCQQQHHLPLFQACRADIRVAQ